jgi:site-specific DNA-cytosine methylase
VKVLELFAGTRSISKAFDKKGHETYSVEWNKDFENITLYEDINNLTVERIIELCGGVPDVIWASPDCTTYSIAGISHHRIKNASTGNLDAVSEYAKFCDKTNKHVLDLIKKIKPKYYFIENPRRWLEENGFYARHS